MTARVLVLILLLWAAPARADYIPSEPALSGFIGVDVHDDFAPYVYLDGYGFRLESVEWPNKTEWSPDWRALNWGMWPGATADLSSSGRFLWGDFMYGEWSTWEIVADPVVLHMGRNVTGFVLRGEILGGMSRNQADPQVATTVFRYFGGGTAEVTLFTQYGVLSWDSIAYVIGAQPTPVPEPATIALLASGIGLFGLRRYLAT